MQLGLKIDVDSERGTRIGVPNLLKVLAKYGYEGTFLFSMGPDNTGRAIRRIFRPGFFQKVQRTSVIKVYGLRTLMNGILWPGPHIAQKHGHIMRQVRHINHEVGVHCYDHVYWQDYLHTLPEHKVREQLNLAHKCFKDVFSFSPKTFGSAGWQASRHSLACYDDFNLLYASDTRGTKPFFPVMGHRTFKTLQIPTTLPTLDELLGRPEYPFDDLIGHYMGLIQKSSFNVLTIHAELEGMAYLDWFDEFLKECSQQKIQCVPLRLMAEQLLENKQNIPILPLIQGQIDGRSGTLAMHG
jgi:undecaprenyl phosphate-alpha-L-ara4FN deformylase